jgi:hypothetical protein
MIMILRARMDGGRRTEDGGRRTEDGGRRTEDGGRRSWSCTVGHRLPVTARVDDKI